MKKIPTIFERDWEGDKTVINKPVVPENFFDTAIATEKLDGMNVRVTVRNHMAVRLEKRRNPDKIQKQKGIIDPWYIDADEFGTADKHLFDALSNTDLSTIRDGEWSGEAVGKDIQGNPLKLPNNRIVLFSVLGYVPAFLDAPHTYEELKAWLPRQKSLYGNDCGIEGIVWHGQDGQMCKIKTKDFVGDKRT